MKSAVGSRTTVAGMRDRHLPSDREQAGQVADSETPLASGLILSHFRTRRLKLA